MPARNINGVEVGRNSSCGMATGERDMLKMYQAFMAGYVRRINAATFNVTIGGVRIGSAKYSRLAQINLKSRIITFSRFAVENVPERGRRYLVLHELAHVKEAYHNQRFWNFVGLYEPNHNQVGRALDLAFRRNVQDEHKKQKKSNQGSLFQKQELKLMNSDSIDDLIQPNFSHEGEDSENLGCLEDDFSFSDAEDDGIIYGGSEDEFFDTDPAQRL